MNSGIYFITCSREARLYIGMTKDFDTRWSQHRTALRKGKHFNRLLQRAWYMHGEDSFSFLRKVYCKPEDLVDTEQRFLQAYTPVVEMFNTRQAPGAPSISERLAGRFRSEETVLKMIDSKSDPITDEELVRQCRASKSCRNPEKTADKFAFNHTSRHMRQVFFDRFGVQPLNMYLS